MVYKRGTTIALGCALQAPAAALYTAVCGKSGLPRGVFCLYFGGKPLEPANSLESKGVKSGAEVEVKLRGLGGVDVGHGGGGGQGKRRGSSGVDAVRHGVVVPPKRPRPPPLTGAVGTLKAGSDVELVDAKVGDTVTVMRGDGNQAYYNLQGPEGVMVRYLMRRGREPSASWSRGYLEKAVAFNDADAVLGGEGCESSTAASGALAL